MSIALCSSWLPWQHSGELTLNECLLHYTAVVSLGMFLEFNSCVELSLLDHSLGMAKIWWQVSFYFLYASKQCSRVGYIIVTNLCGLFDAGPSIWINLLWHKICMIKKMLSLNDSYVWNLLLEPNWILINSRPRWSLVVLSTEWRIRGIGAKLL